MVGDREPSRRSRWAGVVSLSLARLWKRATRTRPRRVATTLVSVAMTVALLVIVTGVALALADGGAVTDDDGDVWIEPAQSETLTTVDGVERPRLGATNERAAELRSHEGVAHASPVLAEPGQLERTTDGERRTVLLVGVVPDGEPRTVGGLPTDELASGDPHYADGSFDGPPEGDIVLSAAAAERLEADAGDQVAVPEPEVATEARSLSLSVSAVVETETAVETDVPVALVHLSELQSFTGAADGELADRIVLWGEEDEATAVATTTYPDAVVESSDGVDPTALFDDGLALATSVLSLLVGLVICASFVATTAGMNVNDDRRSLAVLESVGLSTGSRLTIVAVSTLVTTVCGALLGAGLGIVGIEGLNEFATATVAPGTVALSHSLFLPYAVGVGLLAGLLALPYPLAIAARTSVLEEVGR
ncbi:ABC transporter permease [Halopiger goleimassiliensis]|uniref:ABC transporter permease n=1 Tax=Halopiger goleimassiliensis TaxID=1293048 RepID=UPI0006780745|nr:FtsX-like permease family protein [Halopiger goleimassiliensis]